MAPIKTNTQLLPKFTTRKSQIDMATGFGDHTSPLKRYKEKNRGWGGYIVPTSRPDMANFLRIVRY